MTDKNEWKKIAEDRMILWDRARRDADHHEQLLIDIERNVREHEYPHRRICPSCDCAIGLRYPYIGAEPLTKFHASDCKLEKVSKESHGE